MLSAVHSFPQECKKKDCFKIQSVVNEFQKQINAFIEQIQRISAGVTKKILAKRRENRLKRRKVKKNSTIPGPKPISVTCIVRKPLNEVVEDHLGYKLTIICNLHKYIVCIID